MIKTIALIAVAALAVPLVLAAFKPDTFRVHRSAGIKAPPERLYPLINDMRVFNTWKDVGKGSISSLESTARAEKAV